MVELVVLLDQFVAVVGDAGRVVVRAGLPYGSRESIEVLYEADLLVVEFRLNGQRGRYLDTLGGRLAQDAADAGVGIL